MITLEVVDNLLILTTSKDDNSLIKFLYSNSFFESLYRFNNNQFPLIIHPPVTKYFSYSSENRLSFATWLLNLSAYFSYHLSTDIIEYKDFFQDETVLDLVIPLIGDLNDYYDIQSKTNIPEYLIPWLREKKWIFWKPSDYFYFDYLQEYHELLPIIEEDYNARFNHTQLKLFSLPSTGNKIQNINVIPLIPKFIDNTYDDLIVNRESLKLSQIVDHEQFYTMINKLIFNLIKIPGIVIYGEYLDNLLKNHKEYFSTVYIHIAIVGIKQYELRKTLDNLIELLNKCGYQRIKLSENYLVIDNREESKKFLIDTSIYDDIFQLLSSISLMSNKVIFTNIFSYQSRLIFTQQYLYTFVNRIEVINPYARNKNNWYNIQLVRKSKSHNLLIPKSIHTSFFHENYYLNETLSELLLFLKDSYSFVELPIGTFKEIPNEILFKPFVNISIEKYYEWFPDYLSIPSPNKKINRKNLYSKSKYQTRTYKETFDLVLKKNETSREINKIIQIQDNVNSLSVEERNIHKYLFQ